MSDTVNQTLKRAQVVTRRLTSALRQHVLKAAVTLDAGLDSEATPTQTLASLALTSLETRLGDYNSAQAALNTDERGTRQQRKTRDDAAELLRPALVELGPLVRVVHGSDGVAALALSGSIPRDPESLIIYASRVLDASAEAANAAMLAMPDQGRVRIDFAAMIGDIKDHRDALNAALDAVRDEQRSDQSARVRRDAAYDAWEAEARFVRDMSRAILRRVGLNALADRLLPSNRQIAGSAPLEPEPDAPEPDAEA